MCDFLEKGAKKGKNMLKKGQNILKIFGKNVQNLKIFEKGQVIACD